MPEPVIRAEALTKTFRISHDATERFPTLRDVIARKARGLFGRPSDVAAVTTEDFHALQDVTFDVEAGERIGIIGRNGAGKSILLKILSRITEPTHGRVRIRGRVSALLEVGTGFHPELTGRENIFLNGAILGMTRAEIRQKFDEIVAFSEVHKFLDTPVKRYSSGMHVRLAFAIAAHLEPEILIVDEVLAVGDVQFQKKCLGKMEEVGQQGRTIVFVTHDMGAITRLCQRALLLDRGALLGSGPTHEMVRAYLEIGVTTSPERYWPGPVDALPGDEHVRLRAVRVVDENGVVAEVFDIRRPIGVEFEYEVLQPGRLVPNLHMFNERGDHVFFAMDLDPEWRRRERPSGCFATTAWIPGNFLAEGVFTIGAAVTTYAPLQVHLHERDAVSFRVVDSLDGQSARGDYGGPIPGSVRPLLRWTTKAAERRVASP